jgi:hypothetical protein
MDQRTVDRFGGTYNVLRYAQAHDLQLVTVNYPLDDAAMDTLAAEITAWVESQQVGAPAKAPRKKAAPRKRTGTKK